MQQQIGRKRAIQPPMWSTTTTLLFALLGRLALLLAVAAAHKNYHKNSPRMFEGDLQPVFHQIDNVYGSNFVHELVKIGILTQPPSTNLDQKETTASSSDLYFLWPNPRVNGAVQIPYYFADDFKGDRNFVQKAIEELNQLIGVVRFVHSSNAKHIATRENPALRIVSVKVDRPDMRLPEGFVYDCWSYLGYQHKNGAIQDVNLGDGCLDDSGGVTWHTLLHTLGLWHTNNRHDRDDYLTILWHHLQPGLEYNMQRRLIDDTLGAPYDYASIMHDDPSDYSNGKDVMKAPEPIGQLDHLSEGDILRVRLRYQCVSGPRNYTDYLAHPCTADCPCGVNILGASQRRHDEAPLAIGRPLLHLIALALIVVVAALLLGMRKYLSKPKKNDYETLE